VVVGKNFLNGGFPLAKAPFPNHDFRNCPAGQDESTRDHLARPSHALPPCRQLAPLDMVIVAVFFAIVVGIGIVASRTAGKNTSEFFLGGRGMPWWLLGVSMVACTFSCDTPNLVTGMVREDGVAKNWAWWAFLITGMVTVFIYAKLWRRSEVMTDLEFTKSAIMAPGRRFCGASGPCIWAFFSTA
jgi:hypothetical protein